MGKFRTNSNRMVSGRSGPPIPWFDILGLKTILGKFFSFALVNIADTFMVNQLHSAINILLS